MGRFSIAYNVSEDFKENPDKDLNEEECKIIDTKGVLPDLIITDRDTGKEWVDYLNQPRLEQEISSHITDIKNLIKDLNQLNWNLIEPRKEFITDEEGNKIYHTPIREKLFLEGYQTVVARKSHSIENHLNLLRRLLTEKE